MRTPCSVAYLVSSSGTKLREEPAWSSPTPGACIPACRHNKAPRKQQRSQFGRCDLGGYLPFTVTRAFTPFWLSMACWSAASTKSALHGLSTVTMALPPPRAF